MVQIFETICKRPSPRRQIFTKIKLLIYYDIYNDIGLRIGLPFIIQYCSYDAMDNNIQTSARYAMIWC